MGIRDELENETKRIFKDTWKVTNGKVVPEPDSISLRNEAIKLEPATVLYADLSGSTKMVESYKWHFSAEIYRTFLYCAARLIRNEDGEITAYDGDRVMGVFIGESQSSNAGRCGLKIHYAVNSIIMPALKVQYPSTDFVLKHVVGIDVSTVHVARTGVRGDNDLVWIGRAPNYAAKLTELDAAYPTWITDAVYQRLVDNVKYGGSDKRLMWEERTWTSMNKLKVYRSNWWWPC